MEIYNKLLNLNEEIPKEFFIFVDRYNPITRNNLENSKQITSAGISEATLSENKLNEYIEGMMQFAPYVPNNNCTGIISMFNLNITKEYSVEYEAEYIRSTYFSKYPSRFSCVYAFGDYKTCKEVSLKYGWDINSVKKFRLLDNPLNLNRVVKVNMEFVSLWRSIRYVSFSRSDIDNYWKSYWKCNKEAIIQIPNFTNSSTDMQTVNSGTIYEYLIEGTLKLID